MKGLVTAALLLCVGAGLAPGAAAASREGRVTYVTANTVYVDLGRGDGLSVGQRLELHREDERLGELRVTELSSRRAACEVVETSLPPAVGDRVVVVGELRAAESGATLDPTSIWRRAHLRGRLGVDLLWLTDEGGFGRDLQQPSGHLRLHGEEIFDSSLELDVDVRARRSVYDGETEVVQSRNRVYRLSLGGHTPRLRWRVGRQFASDVGALGLVDGVQVGWTTGMWELKAVGGLQPSGRHLDLDADRLRSGLMVFREGGEGRERWRLGLGMVGAYESGEIDREFAHLRARWRHEGLTLIATQDVDLNRGWKAEVEDRTLAFTRTHLHAIARPGAGVTLMGGFDNRRPIRTLRQRETPETAFDDHYRQGLWLGVRHRVLQRYSWGLRVRTRRGAADEGADALTLSLRGRERWRGHWTAHSRTTVYRNELVEGWLQSLGLDWDGARGLSLGLFGGLRHEEGVEIDLDDFTDPWFGWQADLDLGRRWGLSWTFERSFEEGEAYRENWLSLSLRI